MGIGKNSAVARRTIASKEFAGPVEIKNTTRGPLAARAFRSRAQNISRFMIACAISISPSAVGPSALMRGSAVVPRQ